MKRSILCLCVAAIVGAMSTPAIACDQASRVQLFPVGMIDGDLVALRVVQNRGSDSPMGPVDWSVLSKLVQIDESYTVTVLKTFKRREFRDGDNAHQKAVREQLAAALSIAQKLRGFAPVTMQRRHECKNRRTCSEVSSEWTDDAKLVVKAPGASRDLTKEFDDQTPGDIDLVRTYAAADGVWTVADLRGGSHRCMTHDEALLRECQRARSRSMPVLAVEDSYQWPEVYHHAADYAVVLWSPAKLPSKARPAIHQQ